MSTAASAFPAFLRSFDLPEPGGLRRVARVYVWGRWFVWTLATFAWLYPLNVDEVVHAPNAALAMLLLAINGYLHYRLATERTVSRRWAWWAVAAGWGPGCSAVALRASHAGPTSLSALVLFASNLPSGCLDARRSRERLDGGIRPRFPCGQGGPAATGRIQHGPSGRTV